MVVHLRGNPVTTAAPFASVQALADILDVNRRRIAKWREEGAPQSLDVDLWRGWLRRTGRTKIADRIPDQMPPLAILAAPEAAAAAVPPLPGSVEPATPALGPDATPGDQERFWRSQKWQEQALAARADRLVAERQLFPVAEVQALLAGQATAVVAALNDGVWRALLPLLDGVAPELRKALRKAHDTAVLDIRAHLARDIHERLQAALNAAPAAAKEVP